MAFQVKLAKTKFSFSREPSEGGRWWFWSENFPRFCETDKTETKQKLTRIEISYSLYLPTFHKLISDSGRADDGGGQRASLLLWRSEFEFYNLFALKLLQKNKNKWKEAGTFKTAYFWLTIKHSHFILLLKRH